MNWLPGARGPRRPISAPTAIGPRLPVPGRVSWPRDFPLVEGGSHVAADLARAVGDPQHLTDMVLRHPVSCTSPPSRENENLAKYSHKTPTRDELVEARVIGLANPGSFR